MDRWIRRKSLAAIKRETTMILHLAYGIALALVIFAIYRRPWLGRALLELAALAVFILAIGIGAGFYTGVLR